MFRGGGGNGNDWLITNKSPGTTCQSFCVAMSTTDSQCACCSGCVIAFGKCFDAESATPLNRVRIAFASQIETTAVDPGLSLTSDYTNASYCLCIYL